MAATAVAGLHKALIFFWCRFKRHLQRNLIISGTLIVAIVWMCLPLRLFNAPHSLLLEDRRGDLLSARIAADGQWRFPPSSSVPPRFEAAIITFEDRRFYVHPGFDPAALVRALLLNLHAHKLISGGSTITMQTVRLSRSNPPRTISEKALEIVMSVKLTVRLSKREILALYTANAPFGGNVVGLETAAWRYFGRTPADLSWAECATLAVLPNEPGLVHPGRNRAALLAKRNRLLDALQHREIIDSMQCVLAQAETLVPQIRPLPDMAPQLLTRCARESGDDVRSMQRIRTTIDASLQRQTTEILSRHHRVLWANQIHNGAVLVLDVRSGEVLAYVGNITGDSAVHGNAVDCINAPRSTGSILKPLLFALMLDAGELLPTTLVPDIPTNFGGYTPQNFNREFEGAVPASMALARSLNIPAARMVQQYGIARFCHALQNLGMTTASRPAEEYGISIILGGVEGSLFELTGIYASLARLVDRMHDEPLAAIMGGSFFHPVYIVDRSNKKQNNRSRSDQDPLSAGACFTTLQAMTEVVRPGDESAWKDFASGRTIAWKTGTSFGFRDAWAIGVTPAYAVGVWIGNASGEGRPGLIGIEAAAPILFDIVNILPRGDRWFYKPQNDLHQFTVCRQSGFKAGPWCTQTDSIAAPPAGQRTGPCPYHQIIHLDKKGLWRVNSVCENVAAMEHRSWFVLPPAIEAYYRARHSDYRVLPPLRADCSGIDQLTAMGLVYPHGDGQIFIPRELDGSRGRAALKAVHRDAGATIHWHLDDQYLGSTVTLHEMAIAPKAGCHQLVLVDNQGNRIERKVTFIEK